jgi:hypothetical protein
MRTITSARRAVHLSPKTRSAVISLASPGAGFLRASPAAGAAITPPCACHQMRWLPARFPQKQATVAYKGFNSPLLWWHEPRLFVLFESRANVQAEQMFKLQLLQLHAPC